MQSPNARMLVASSSMAIVRIIMMHARSGASSERHRYSAPVERNTWARFVVVVAVAACNKEYSNAPACVSSGDASRGAVTPGVAFRSPSRSLSRSRSQGGASPRRGDSSVASTSPNSVALPTFHGVPDARPLTSACISSPCRRSDWSSKRSYRPPRSSRRRSGSSRSACSRS